MQTYTRVVSADGKTLTLTVDGTDAKGRKVHNVIVYALAPLTLLGAAAGLVALCLSRRWGLAGSGAPPGAAPPEAGAPESSGSGPEADRVGAADHALSEHPAA